MSGSGTNMDRRAFLRRLGATAFAAPVVTTFALDNASAAEAADQGAYCGNQLGVIIGNQLFSRIYFKATSGRKSSRVALLGVIEDVIDEDVEHQLFGSFVVHGPAGSIRACGVRDVAVFPGSPGDYNVTIRAWAVGNQPVELRLVVDDNVPHIAHASGPGGVVYSNITSSRGIFQLS